jgi:hypothetical protein
VLMKDLQADHAFQTSGLKIRTSLSGPGHDGIIKPRLRNTVAASSRLLSAMSGSPHSLDLQGKYQSLQMEKPSTFGILIWVPVPSGMPAQIAAAMKLSTSSTVPVTFAMPTSPSTKKSTRTAATVPGTPLSSSPTIERSVSTPKRATSQPASRKSAVKKSDDKISNYWRVDEIDAFHRFIEAYGRNFDTIATHFPRKTAREVRLFLFHPKFLADFGQLTVKTCECRSRTISTNAVRILHMRRIN